MLWKKLIERKVNTDSLWKGLADRLAGFLSSEICVCIFNQILIIQLFACLNLHNILSYPQEGLGSVPVQAETRGVPPLPLLLQEALPFHHQGHRREYGGDVVIMTCLMNSLCEIHSFILTNIAGDRGQLAGREAQPAAHQLPKREQQRSLLPPVR